MHKLSLHNFRDMTYLQLISLFTLLVLLNTILYGQNSTVKNWAANPVVITEPVLQDTDDPAIWYNKKRPAKSLIIGTDKGGDTGEGGIYLYNLDGKIVNKILGIKRPNNIDITYDFPISNNRNIDIAVFTERGANKIRVLSMPDFKFVDNGGIDVFVDEQARAPMGVALYKNEDKTYAIVGRKSGPTNGYLHQYLLQTNDKGEVTGELIRKFGNYSGIKEIEAIAVDNEMGYVYYSDENVGIRKYYAHPDSSSNELALFGTTGFTQDQEGISIYKTGQESGFIIVSDQQANQFQIFNREGNEHHLLGIVKIKTNESDGSDVIHARLSRKFKKGIFVAMSTDKTFHYYRIEDILGELLTYVTPNTKF